MSALGHRHRSSKLKKPKKTTEGGPTLRRAADQRNDEHCYAGSVSHASNHVAPITGVDPCSCTGRSHEIDKRAELVSREKSINLIDFESVPCCIDQWNGASLTDNSTKIAQYDVAKGEAQTATAKLD